MIKQHFLNINMSIYENTSPNLASSIEWQIACLQIVEIRQIRQKYLTKQIITYFFIKMKVFGIRKVSIESQLTLNRRLFNIP